VPLNVYPTNDGYVAVNIAVEEQVSRSIVYKERSEVDRAPFRASILTHYGNPI
jgi:hypothetical protein